MGRKVGQTVTLGRPCALPHLVDAEAYQKTFAAGHLGIVYMFQAENGRRKMIKGIAHSLPAVAGCLLQEAALHLSRCRGA